MENIVKNYRDEDETNKSNTETVWSGDEANVREIPESCSFTKLSRRDSKGFNSQNCEMRSKSMRRVLTSLVETTPARMTLTMVLVLRISSLVCE